MYTRAFTTAIHRIRTSRMTPTGTQAGSEKGFWRQWRLGMAGFMLIMGVLLLFDQRANATPKPIDNAMIAGRKGEVCADLYPLEPVLAADAQERRCQEAIVWAAQHYTQRILAAEQACLHRVQQGTLSGDATALCRGLRFLSSEHLQLPLDTTTAQEILDAETELRSRLQEYCTDATVASLATVASFEGCDATVEGLQQCLVADHWDHVQHALDQQYGTLVPTHDLEIQHCQATIAQELG